MNLKNLFLLLLLSLPLFASENPQIAISDLIRFIQSKSWNQVNNSLIEKGWEYSGSTEETDSTYMKITWSFEESSYDDRAFGWIKLYINDGYSSKINYQVFNNNSYKLLKKGITNTGFKLVDSKVYNDNISSIYEKGNFILSIDTERRGSNKTVAYSIDLIIKNSLFDTENGQKTMSFEDGSMQYTLKNGKWNGPFKVFYKNGKLKKEGYSFNDKKNGEFKEYNLDGSLAAKYTMEKDSLNGVMVEYSYNSGSLTKIITSNYLNGVLSGNLFIDTLINGNQIRQTEKSFYKNRLHGIYKTLSDNGELIVVNYVNGVREGKRSFYSKRNNQKFNSVTESIGNSYLTYFETYQNGKLNGRIKYLNTTDNSIIIKNYVNDSINGEYLEFSNSSKIKSCDTETNKLTLRVKGKYIQGKAIGLWHFYDEDGKLVITGNFENDQKVGNWKYYFGNVFYKDTDSLLACSGKTYLIAEYKNGKLNGTFKRFAVLIDTCSTVDTSDCQITGYHRYEITKTYKNDTLDGYYEYKDSDGEIIEKGTYKLGKKDGYWIESEMFGWLKSTGYYQNGKKSGNWEETINLGELSLISKGKYHNDYKDGKWEVYNLESTLLETNFYSNKGNECLRTTTASAPLGIRKELTINNKLVSVTKYGLENSDSTKLTIVSQTDKSLSCIITNYSGELQTSQDYYWQSLDSTFNVRAWDTLFYADSISIKKDGQYIEMFKADTLVKGQFKADSMVGNWKYYDYNNGVVCQKTILPFSEEYKDLQGAPFSGSFTYYDWVNNKKEVRSIKKGIRHGKSVTYNLKTNDLLFTEKYKKGLKRN